MQAMSNEAEEQGFSVASSSSTREQPTFPHLPFDLFLRITDFLPSPLLFSSRLCKATALLTLAHRPFFVFQHASLSSLCYLLPLDTPSTPLSCSFKVAKPSFRLVVASGNLLCLQRQSPVMLDICICSIFRRWKVNLPRIVHRSNPLSVVGFYVQPIFDTHAAHTHQPFHPIYRVFVANSEFLRVYDSCTQRWSSCVDFLSHFPSQISLESLGLGFPNSMPLGQGVVTFDGNLILTFSPSTRLLFKCEDQSFSDMWLPFHPSMEIAGYPATACVGPSFFLEVTLPHVEGISKSSTRQGLQLRHLCRGDHELPSHYTFRVAYQWCYKGCYHEHEYARTLLKSHCFAYQGKVYALLAEIEEMRCSKERAMQRRGIAEWHPISSGDVRAILHKDIDDASFSCFCNFPWRSPLKLTLYSGSVDPTNWTLHVRKEADASAFLNYVGNNMDWILGRLLLG